MSEFNVNVEFKVICEGCEHLLGVDVDIDGVRGTIDDLHSAWRGRP